MNTKEKAEIWKEYFDKLLNTEKPRELIKKGNEDLTYRAAIQDVWGVLLGYWGLDGGNKTSFFQ